MLANFKRLEAIESMTLDISQLLQTIPGDNPSGQDPRLDTSATSLYWQMKETRNQARDIERESNILSSASSTKNLWEKVSSAGEKILLTQGKDLQVSCWLTESLIRLEGFSGLKDGFSLSYGLVQNFWDNLYPLPDNDKDFTSRVSFFYGLNGEDREGTLIAPIQNAFIVQSKSGTNYTVWQYQQSLGFENIKDPAKQKQMLEGGIPKPQDLEFAIRETSTEFFQTTYNDIQGCLDQLQLLDEALTEKTGNQAPSFTSIRDSLNVCLEYVAGFLKTRVSPLPSDENKNQQLSSSPQTNINDRDSALRAMESIADYFSAHEPQSPLPYLIRQVVRWGKMSLPELLGELIDDDRVQSSLSRLTGMEIKKPTEDA